MLIEAMQKANSSDPKKYLPVLQKLDFKGATGKIAFDDKGDRKDAEMTIFTMKGGKLTPVAVIGRQDADLRRVRQSREVRRCGKGQETAPSGAVFLMDTFLQQMVNGLTAGSVYAVVALGYTMVYGIIQLINFAHGRW